MAKLSTQQMARMDALALNDIALHRRMVTALATITDEFYALYLKCVRGNADDTPRQMSFSDLEAK